MNHLEAGAYWNGNAAAWTLMARSGYDIYRDQLNTPAFFAMLPPVEGLVGLDIGCGEGHNTRLLAGLGARMQGIDISEVFIKAAGEKESEEPLGIEYSVASAVALPYADETFDFATGFMSFMDIPETDLVIREAFRVLKRGGFLQFSITHPCFDTPHRKNLRDEHRKTYAVEVGDYFTNDEGRVDEWIFKSAPEPLKSSVPKFLTPHFTRTLSQWLNMLIEAGFALEQVAEPRPDDETVRRYPGLQDAQVVAYFLHLRCRKK